MEKTEGKGGAAHAGSLNVRSRLWAGVVLTTILLCNGLWSANAMAEACASWPAWSSFRTQFVNDGGRVIDPSTPQRVTTSEGQSYGLFFALIANDSESFDRILRWTEVNLAGGDLTAHLPAWKWGERDDSSWGVIDANTASDADVWIAYTLGEAARLWHKPRYAALGELLAQRILRDETVVMPGLGRALLPGARGFETAPGLWRLNPSYLPMQLLRHLAVIYPQSEWKRVATTASDIIVRSAPRGFAPDWVRYRADTGFIADVDTSGVGSFNAIRVYLWAGMLSADDPLRAVLIKALLPMSQLVDAQGTPPLEVDTRSGIATGVGPAGFSAALLPFLDAARRKDSLRRQLLRVEAKAPLEGRDNYYEQALTLFSLGWMDGRFRFDRNGALVLRWKCLSN